MDLINSPAFALKINELLRQEHTPGLAVAVVQNSTITSKGFGLATVDPPTNVTADTLFDVASSSKSLTAASVGLLAVDDFKYPQLYWDTPMSYLLPDDFVMSGDAFTNQVSVEDILSHRSGFPRHDISYLGIRAEHPDTPQSITRNLRNLPTAAPLRTKWMYSNIMYIVASWLVEAMSGLAFADFLQQHIFEPLGMNSTHLQPSAAIRAGLEDRMATPYTWDEQNEALKPISWIEAPEAQGCGSIFTSANDYIKWVRAIMNQESPITQELYDGMLEPRIQILPDDDNPDAPEYWYATGFMITDVLDYKVVIHDGLVSGFQSFHFFIQELKFGAVIFANAGDHSDILNPVAIELLKDVLNVTSIGSSESIKTKRAVETAPTRKKYDLQQRLCPTSTHVEYRDIDPSIYTGRYCNKGYHCFTIEARNRSETDGSKSNFSSEQYLFVNATDRSNAFTATFEYACDERTFMVRIVDYFDGDIFFTPAEFQLEDGRAVKVGAPLEDELDEYIWFDRVSDEDLMVEQVEL